MPELINTHDGTGAPSAAPKPLASWYAQGLTDGLGDRLLMFDNSEAPSLELLRFRPDFAQVPGFEEALRERVRRLAQFQHPAFARVRSVQRLEPDHDLALISNCTPGKRLSEVLHHMRGPAAAAALIQQLGPAMALLQQHDDGIGHGVLSPARIVVSPDGRLTIVEHVIGPAIETLELRRDQLASLDIALPPAADGATPLLDVASDWYQLGLVAMSLLMGRQPTASEVPQLATLLDAAGRLRRGDSSPLSPFMRDWLARALQISGPRIESGADAGDALAELLRKEQSRDVRRIESSQPPAADEVMTPEPAAPQHPAAPEQAAEPAAASPSADESFLAFPAEDELVQPAAELVTRAEGAAVAVTQTRSQPETAQSAPARVAPPPAAVQPRSHHEPLAAWPQVAIVPATPPAAREPHPAPQPALQPKTIVVTRRPVSSMVLIGLALVAAVEAGIIGALARALWLTPRPALVVDTTPAGDNVVVSSASSDVPPLRVAVAPDLRWVRITTPSSTGVLGGKLTSIATGMVLISSPIELKVLEGSRVLGSIPGGGIKLPAGRHEIALVNETLGYRLQQSVDIEGGQTLSLQVAPPPGMVTIDAVPWADLTIDGQAVGRTPVGPLPLVPGLHTISFHNPDFGGDSQRVIVKSAAKVRVVGKLVR
jgi:serine/threonine-protein kinase